MRVRRVVKSVHLGGQEVTPLLDKEAGLVGETHGRLERREAIPCHLGGTGEHRISCIRTPFLILLHSQCYLSKADPALAP